MRSLALRVVLVLVLALVLSFRPHAAPGQTRGGTLTLTLREDLPTGFSLHETTTISVIWPAMPCFSNLVMFDPAKPLESVESIIPELAERWSWQDNYRQIVFFLRKNVKWHDGQPFTARDVKYTFDMVREAPGATAKLRLNPRKAWYGNVEAIEVVDPHTVVFRLRRPQPSLLLMLAGGGSPVYPAHVAPAEFRTRCVGTGPFKLKEWKLGEYIDYVRNPEYFIKDRPYLDGLRYVVIKDRSTRMAALKTGQVDTSVPADVSRIAAEQLKQAVPQLVITRSGLNLSDNLLMNLKRPPFDNKTVRLALSYAIDRQGLVQSVHQGTAAAGASMPPPPLGIWGLSGKDLAALPGFGDAAQGKARARALLAEAGFGRGTPLRVEMTTRAIAEYTDMASFVVNELKQVGVEATLKLLDTAQFYPAMARGDFAIAANLTSQGPDDPDVNYYDTYACGSPRNYMQYCSPEMMKLIEQQSQELDRKKRLKLVHDIQRRLEQDAVRPMLIWRTDYFTVWPHVRGLIPHQSGYNCCRMQDVWRAR